MNDLDEGHIVAIWPRKDRSKMGGYGGCKIFYFILSQSLTALGHEVNRKWKKKFPNGVNVNCLQYVDAATLKVLTFERGVYKVTGSCGTGSLSCTIVAMDNEYVSSESKITIRVRKGELKIFCLNHTFWLGGPVVFSKKKLS